MTRTRKSLGIGWVVALALAMLTSRVREVLGAADRFLPGLSAIEFLAKLAFVCLTVYWFAVFVRYLLRRLFWRVGRRLALSYFLIGVLPFVLFAVLVLVIGYSIAGVLSQTAYRAERQTFLSRMNLWNLEYALGADRPGGSLPSMRIYDVTGRQREIPAWLATQSFNGLVQLDGNAALVSSHLYGHRAPFRSVVLVQPLDEQWVKYLEKKNGMIVSYSPARQKNVGPREGAGAKGSSNTLRIEQGNGKAIEADIDESIFESFFERGLRPDGVVWGDLSPPLTDWNTGEPDPNRKVFTLIWNPWSNLLEFYFGSSEYAKGMLTVVGGIASSLLLIYLPATLLAVVLIFSISRAVNRIEKGTQAVERGDFSYRINMKPRNQLGQMAQSFDRMTESISSLLTNVAEKERLQSEIAIAASIQRNLLPREGPQALGVSFSAHFEPTASIGGDYYDVFNLDKGRLAVAIGDVSGHGLSTGLVMAMVKAAITTLVEEGADEESLFRRLNQLVFRSTEKRAFMTLAFTIFDLERATIRHTNAGHLYPYVLRRGNAPLAIESPSLPLGVRSEAQPKTVEIPLLEGDTIVYLSDGIVEAQDEQGDPFGFDQLELLLAQTTGQSPSEIQHVVLDAMERHSGRRAADDDRTVMVIRFDQLPAGVNSLAAAAGSQSA